MKFAATARQPVPYTDSGGSQWFIPSSLIQFEDGQPKLNVDPLHPLATQAADIEKWFKVLTDEGLLTAGTAPAAKAAMLITAKNAGASGNSIKIETSNIRPDPADATKTIFDATVTETNVYAGLTPTTIKGVIGTSAGGGTSPGLVFVASAADATQPLNGAYALANDPAVVDVGTPAAFQLQSKATGPDGALTTATISAADDAANPNTFTLTVTWTKQVSGKQASDLATEFGYEIDVTAPPGESLGPPAEGAYVLSGGTETETNQAKKASAMLPAAS